ncbi:hypothetical protein COLO4_36976 [Corchorus olitorius]|uniref:Uncharacterized protein n=1 Tax=Corchorus olitorius TaxID=93759 RepID=A0A1R3G3W3_9ROSI|nr:hypothetical protein COLO4_36976 [Corchorus olitorius]
MGSTVSKGSILSCQVALLVIAFGSCPVALPIRFGRLEIFGLGYVNREITS